MIHHFGVIVNRILLPVLEKIEQLTPSGSRTERNADAFGILPRRENMPPACFLIRLSNPITHPIKKESSVATAFDAEQDSLRRQSCGLRSGDYGFSPALKKCPVAVPDQIFGLTLSLDLIDRCHSLTSLHLPLAALGSLPTGHFFAQPAAEPPSSNPITGPEKRE